MNAPDWQPWQWQLAGMWAGKAALAEDRMRGMSECRTCGGVKYMLGDCYPCPECKPPLICPYCRDEEVRRQRMLKRIAKGMRLPRAVLSGLTRAEFARNGQLLARSRRARSGSQAPSPRSIRAPAAGGLGQLFR